MKSLVIAIILLLSLTALGQESNFPNAPSHLSVDIDRIHKPSMKLFWLSEATQYSGIFFDGAMTSYGVKHGCFYEGNSLFAANGGRTYLAGKYYAINLPIAAGFTLAHVYVYKKTQNALARRLMDIVSIANGAPHIYQGFRGLRYCN